MKSKSFLSFLFFLLCVISPALGQQVYINPIPAIDQLPSNSILRIFQDKEGFIWFGTLDGLCRYDGYNILVFRSDINNPNLLTNNEITYITEDSKGQLWIGTKKGMNILNKHNYTVTAFESSELQDVEIKCITVTDDNNIWVGTNRQVLRYNPDMTLRKKYDSSLPIAGINSIYEDKGGDIWVSIWKNGLHKYDKEKDSFIRYPGIASNNNPFMLYQDNDDRYWICTWGDGLFSFDPTKNDGSAYTPIKIENLELPATGTSFFSITQDDKFGYFWIISLSGIHVLKQNGDNVLQPVDISNRFKEYNNIFSEVIKDKKGNLWIASFGEGVITANFDHPVIKNHALSAIKDRTGITTNITAIYEDKDNDLWLNQNRWGLTFFNPTSGDIKFYTDIPELKNLPGLDIVSCISGFRSMPNEIWLGTRDLSLIHCVEKTRNDITVKRTIDLNTISDDPGEPRCFFEDRKNNIWISTRVGLFIKPYNKNEIEPFNYYFGSITGITEDTKGNIWISTKSNGLYCIESTGTRISKSNIKKYGLDTEILNCDNILSICADLNGNVWIGTKESKIIAYNVNSMEFKDLSKSLKTIGEGILNIITDDNGHVWIVTNKRIIEYNPLNDASRDYTETDGILVNSFIADSHFKSRSGELFFGGNKGISIFNSSDILSGEPQKVKTYITDIKINNQSIFSNNKNDQLDILSQTIKFEPGDKNIEIDFSSLNYSFPGKVKYAYKLEGIDDDWIHTENNRQFAIYNNIKKGKHNFYVKATDENGLWSKEANRLRIYKRPAFYETTLAFVLYLILLIAGIYLTYRIVTNRIKLRNELRIAQIEKEKSEELTQAKLRYFTNISHDFLTPLTIISCLIDDIEVTYKDKSTEFDTMRSNINRLKRLLQQVLDFRKVESGNMKLKISHGDIVTFIKDACYTNFIPLMKRKNIKFSFQSTPLQIEAYFDADKIDKIIYNMLSNAFKYTPQDGEVKVIIKEFEQRGHPHIEIKVIDTGIGIAKEDLEKIFTRFYTNKDGETHDTNGIGLSLTKDLLDLHHGSIKAESELKKGTTFTIVIPIDKESYSLSELGLSQPITINEKKIDLMSLDEIEEKNQKKKEEKNKSTILLVEDNEELLTLMSNILSKSYNVITARNGLEALDVVKDNDIDIVVSDVMMPEMDGLKLTRMLKKDIETSHIPVILLTAKNSTEDRIECYNAGADGYISKPFELKVLDARINNFISNKKDRQKEFKKDVEINISTLEYPSLDEQFLKNAVDIIEGKLSDVDFDVNSFADSLYMSKSSLYRKIKTMTGLSPNEFIRNIRLKHACQMLIDPSIPISEVAYSVGFSDPKYFTLCFKNEFGSTPSEYQKANNKKK